jgi:hypothetical protein
MAGYRILTSPLALGSIQRVPSMGVKLSRHEGDHSTPTSAKAKKMWIFIYLYD